MKLHLRAPLYLWCFSIKIKNILANHFVNPIFARLLKFKQIKTIQNAK